MDDGWEEREGHAAAATGPPRATRCCRCRCRLQMVLPVALGFASGCMVWMVFAELLPDALERAEAAQVRRNARAPLRWMWHLHNACRMAVLRAGPKLAAHPSCARRWPRPPRWRRRAWRASACSLLRWSRQTDPLHRLSHRAACLHARRRPCWCCCLRWRQRWPAQARWEAARSRRLWPGASWRRWRHAAAAAHSSISCSGARWCEGGLLCRPGRLHVR